MIHGKTVLSSASCSQISQKYIVTADNIFFRNGLFSTETTRLPVPVETIVSPWRWQDHQDK